MECLKCGRETAGSEVFCAECLKSMENSPVKVNSPVVIPHRDARQRRAPQKKTPKPEEIIAGLNQKIKRLRVALCVIGALFVLSTCALGYLVWDSINETDLGSNYSTVISPDEGGSR